jgi:hypothetical protein
MKSTFLVVLAAAGLVSASPAFAKCEPDAPLRSREEVSAWAKRLYGPSFEQYEFKRGEKEVVVIIGTPTFGVTTSEVFLFGRVKAGPFELLVTRGRFVGIAKVKDTGSGIDVYDDYQARRSQEPSPRPMLFIPWTGIGHGPR